MLIRNINQTGFPLLQQCTAKGNQSVESTSGLYLLYIEVIFYTCNDIIPMLRSKSTHKHSPHSLSFFSLHLPQAIKVIKTTKSYIFATLLKSLDYKIKECNTTAIFRHGLNLQTLIKLHLNLNQNLNQASYSDASSLYPRSQHNVSTTAGSKTKNHICCKFPTKERLLSL